MSARRARQWVALWITLGATFAAIAAAIAAFGHESFARVALACIGFSAPAWIGNFLYTRRNWRCAGCGSTLPASSGNGYMFRAAACPACHAALR